VEWSGLEWSGVEWSVSSNIARRKAKSFYSLVEGTLSLRSVILCAVVTTGGGRGVKGG